MCTVLKTIFFFIIMADARFYIGVGGLGKEWARRMIIMDDPFLHSVDTINNSIIQFR